MEEVEVVLGLQRLFSPRVLIAFPPPGFVFHKGVGPFWKINIEEDEKKLKVRTPRARWHTHTRVGTHTCTRARAHTRVLALESNSGYPVVTTLSAVEQACR